MTKNKKGFTIIEVVLVLAIAGLIFLMVFIALPALQRSQRNTRRRQDLARIATAVNDYQSNNGKLPFPVITPNKINYVDEDFVKRYISDSCTKSGGANEDIAFYGGESSELNKIQKYTNCSEQFTDPDGSIYNLYAPKAVISGDIESVYKKASGEIPSFEDNNHLIFALAKAKCGSENEAKLADGPNNFALFYLLEGGSVYCVDNQ